MRRKEFFRGGEIVEGIVVNEKELGYVLNACSYVSISNADVQKLGIKWKTEDDLEKLDDNKIVGVIFGDIDNVFRDVVDPDYTVGVVENPDCWFVNKEFLEANYKDIEKDKFKFGEAVELGMKGYKIAREGWNGKGMWLVYVSGKEVEVREGTEYYKAGLRGKLKIDGHFDMYTAQKTMQPGWLASQADIRAEDWIVVDKLED